MLETIYERRFKKDYKLALRRGCREEKLRAVIEILAEERPLPAKHKDHQLTNSRNYKNARECPIEPDWLLIYRIENEIEILRLIRTGSHSDLFVL